MHIFQSIQFGGEGPEDEGGGRPTWDSLVRSHFERSFGIIVVCGLILTVSLIATLIHYIDPLFGVASAVSSPAALRTSAGASQRSGQYGDF